VLNSTIVSTVGESARISAHSEELQASLEESINRHHVPGASVAIFYNSALLTASAGVVNMSTGVGITPATVMHVGSITKVFNATLIMQLVDQGLIDLDAQVRRYLPDLTLKDRRALEQITVRMLLNHTSGIDGMLLNDHGHDEETIEKGISRFAELGQLFQPGTGFSYCNAAAVIAGYLVQQLIGKSWFHIVKDRILIPLGMENFATLPEEALLHRASVGHYLSRQPGASKPVRTSFAFLPLSFAPAGATLMMSAVDLIKFAQAHINSGVGLNGVRILSLQSTQAMQRLTVRYKDNGYSYAGGVGLGWMITADGTLEHGGGGPGTVAQLYVKPDSEFAAAILTNSAHGANLINDLMDPWFKKLGIKRTEHLTDSNHTNGPVEIDATKYVGVFEDVANRYRVLQTSEGLALTHEAKIAPYENISRHETAPSPLIPLGNGQFLLFDDKLPDDGSYYSLRTFTFKGLNEAGCPCQLLHGLTLYPRTS
jgi:CubicO group peptidase (beta-lactamase class C family)